MRARGLLATLAPCAQCTRLVLSNFDRNPSLRQRRRQSYSYHQVGVHISEKKEGGGGGKAKKKKWSKGKSRDKLNNLVLFDKGTYDKLLKEVPTYKLITPSIVSERLKVRGSLARKALNELLQKGLIKQVVQHSSQTIYARPRFSKPSDASAHGAPWKRKISRRQHLCCQGS